MDFRDSETSSPNPNTEAPVASGALVALALRARAGDRRAFGQLYEALAPMVHAILLAGAVRSEVDDLMQEVFLAGWRNIATLRQTTHVGAWFAAIARNQAASSHRRRVKLDALPDDIPGAPSHPDGYGDEILESIRSLPPAYRETLAMRLVEGLSGPEIAAATGLTHGSVRVNLSRGMELLRTRLRKEGFT